MSFTRRYAIRQLAAMFGAPFVCGQEQLDDPLLEPVCVMDFAQLAKAKLDPVAWDYLELGGSDEVTLRDNVEAYQRIVIRPRQLVDVQKIDISLELFGQKLDYPILLDPAGGKNCFHADGENVVARAAAAAKAVHITNGGIEKTVSAGNGPVWWQLTTGRHLENPDDMREFARRLEDSGCSGIVFSTDIMYVSRRDRNIRNKFDRSWCELPGGIPRDANGRLPRPKNPERVAVYPTRRRPTVTWPAVAELRSITKLPVVIKGILTSEDAELAVKHGASGIIVSNHGGRQLDHVPATIDALPEVVEGTGGKIPVLVDGGIRRGTDIIKALALGAKAVCVARPYLYGLTAFGQRGVERVIELLRTELALDMGLAGVPNLGAINRNLVRYRKEYLR